MMERERCYECGQIKPAVAPKKRSIRDHSRFFVIIGKAFQHWPESHPFQPESANHLRYWLTCKAGPEWRSATPVTWPGLRTDADRQRFIAVVEAAIRAGRMPGEDDDEVARRFVVQHGHGVAVLRAKSIAVANMGQADFGRLRDAVCEVIEAEMSTTIEELLRHDQA